MCFRSWFLFSLSFILINHLRADLLLWLFSSIMYVYDSIPSLTRVNTTKIEMETAINLACFIWNVNIEYLKHISTSKEKNTATKNPKKSYLLSSVYFQTDSITDINLTRLSFLFDFCWDCALPLVKLIPPWDPVNPGHHPSLSCLLSADIAHSSDTLYLRAALRVTVPLFYIINYLLFFNFKVYIFKYYIQSIKFIYLPLMGPQGAIGKSCIENEQYAQQINTRGREIYHWQYRQI